LLIEGGGGERRTEVNRTRVDLVEEKLNELKPHFPKWEIVKDMIDQLIDMMLNFRQSGHPGGSRSKVHGLVATMLSGVMRWDIRHPEKRFGDRFVLVAGHTIPLVYATLAVLNEALRVKHKQTGDSRYEVPNAKERQLTWEDLLGFRHNGGLPGHAEMAGKTLFLKFNTGPSGHGSPPAAGEALALKCAGVPEVKVFAIEGEGGLTPGGNHEMMNSAYGLGLTNLYYLIDWNDFGIDGHRISEIIHGTPGDWFESHGWRTFFAENGSDWPDVARAIVEMVYGPNEKGVPSMAYLKTRKGRGYLKYDNISHGAPHKPMNSEKYWETKKPFAEKYGIEFEGFGEPAPEDHEKRMEQVATNINRVLDVLRRDQELVDYLADTLVSLGESVPEKIDGFRLGGKKKLLDDPRLYDFENYPEELYAKPGEKLPNRAALGKFGSWINAFAKKHYDRPLFIVSSADLADSTNISGFAHDWSEDMPGWGKYDRTTNVEGVLLPQAITEFANAGIGVGMASVNFAENPFQEFDGFYSAFSTYGSFVYLKYGLMRLYSQLSQDCDLKVGKIVWVAGHSGPETADDSRTHFGIFAPGVTQLFPKGQVINLHPWEYNEVPVVLGASLKLDVPIIALHLTRPPVEIPDRKALGIPSHFEAAKGAYVMRPYKEGEKKLGTVLVQGTSTTNGVLKILPELDKRGLNVKIVAAISPQLFELQPKSYREGILSETDRLDAMAVTNRALRLMQDWVSHEVVMEYSLSSDWDNRWRTGGTLDEVLVEAHLSPDHILEAIERFCREREKRLAKIKGVCDRLR